MRAKKKWLNDNRGAALVSVLIAVAFIAILASTLLYMTYSNYKMKVVNYESKVNFYGTEHDMTSLSTTIRNRITKASSDPVGELKTITGYSQIDISNPSSGARYNPSKLASLVYSGLAADTTEVYIDEDRAIVSDASAADMKVTFSTNITDTTIPNFTVENDMSAGDDGVLGTADDVENTAVQVVTLKGVVIEQEELASGYTNKITTDLVYRVKTSPSASSSGVGDFSMIMDTPLDCTTSEPARLTLYGNVMIGSNEYATCVDTRSAEQGGMFEADGVTHATVYKPGSNGAKPALHLGGDTIFTLVGDYMIIMGDVVLDDSAILNIVSGQITICGDVYVNGDSSFMCTGTVYFPYGNKPHSATEQYGITTNQASILNSDGVTYTATSGVGNSSNILTGSVQQLSKDNYLGLLNTLGLNDTDTTNDGVMNKLFAQTTTAGAYDIYDYANMTGGDTRTTSSINVEGITYETKVTSNSQVANGNDFRGQLAIFTSDYGKCLQDGGSLNATLLSLNPISFNNHKSFRFSQLGNAAFNALITDTSQKINNPNGSTPQVAIADLFVSDPNSVINSIVNFATDGGGGANSVESAVGYVNWTKE